MGEIIRRYFVNSTNQPPCFITCNPGYELKEKYSDKNTEDKLERFCEPLKVGVADDIWLNVFDLDTNDDSGYSYLTGLK